MRKSKKLRVLQPEFDASDLPLAMAMSVYEINLREISAFCGRRPMDVAYHFSRSWVNQIPEISDSRTKSLPKMMREAYQRMATIRDQIVAERLEKASKIEHAVSPKFAKGDFVKIRREQPVGACKKRHRPWSAKNVLNHTNSLLLEEEGSDPRIRPVWLRSHQSVAKKVQKRCDFVAVCEKDSAVPLPEAKQESVEFSVSENWK